MTILHCEPEMEISHLHIAFKDFEGALSFFKEILAVNFLEIADGFAVISLNGIELAIHSDWGDGNTSMTLALKSDDCENDLNLLVARGAKVREAPTIKTNSINASIWGPGKLVIELEQTR